MSTQSQTSRLDASFEKLAERPSLPRFLAYCALLVEGSERGEYSRDGAAYGIVSCSLNSHIDNALAGEPAYRDILSYAMSLDFAPEAHDGLTQAEAEAKFARLWREMVALIRVEASSSE